jgi:osmotically-inducible protein OsmY
MLLPPLGAANLGGNTAQGGQKREGQTKDPRADVLRHQCGDDITVELSGYGKRTDQDIAAAALNALKWDFEVPEDKVKVVVKNGLVILEGTVDWQYQKDAAERCVRYLMGVIAVSNKVGINPSAKWIDVKTKIEDAFRRNADIEARRISVGTADGNVTLSGRVSSWAENDEAVSAAWAAPGVTSVRNDLTITP